MKILWRRAPTHRRKIGNLSELPSREFNARCADVLGRPSITSTTQQRVSQERWSGNQRNVYRGKGQLQLVKIHDQIIKACECSQKANSAEQGARHILLVASWMDGHRYTIYSSAGRPRSQMGMALFFLSLHAYASSKSSVTCNKEHFRSQRLSFSPLALPREHPIVTFYFLYIYTIFLVLLRNFS